jgi:hypothetical protein
MSVISSTYNVFAHHENQKGGLILTLKAAFLSVHS